MVANCVVLVLELAVGAAGVPVNVGDAISALLFTAVSIATNSAFISAPLTILLAFPLARLSLVAKLVSCV